MEATSTTATVSPAAGGEIAPDRAVEAPYVTTARDAVSVTDSVCDRAGAAPATRAIVVATSTKVPRRARQPLTRTLSYTSAGARGV